MKTSFTVKSVANKDSDIGSTADLRSGGGSSKKEKHKGSLQSLNKAASNLGGSLLSLGTKVTKLTITVQGNLTRLTSLVS